MDVLTEKMMEDITNEWIGPDKKLISAYFYINGISVINFICRSFAKEKEPLIRNFILSFEEGVGIHVIKVEKHLKPLKYETLIPLKEIKKVKTGSMPMGYKLSIITQTKDGQRRKFPFLSPIHMDGFSNHHQQVTKFMKKVSQL